MSMVDENELAAPDAPASAPVTAAAPEPAPVLFEAGEPPDAPASAPATAAAPEPAPVLFEAGELALLTSTIAKADGTRSRGHTLVRVLFPKDAGYRVSLGRGLTTVVHRNHLSKPTTSIDATLSVGDVIELA